MTTTKKQSGLVSLLMLTFLFAFSVVSFAQTEEEKKESKKTVIVTKVIDENGKETVKRIEKDGSELSEEEMSKLIKESLKEEGIEMDVDVEIDDATEKVVEDDGNKKVIQKQIKITMDGDEVKKEGDDEDLIIIKTDDGQVIKWKEDEDMKKDGDNVMIFKTDEGDIIKMKSKDIHVEHGDEDMQVISVEEKIIEKDGMIEKHIIKKGIPKSSGQSRAFLGVMLDAESDGVKITETVEDSPAQKAGLQKDDVIKSINGEAVESYEGLIKTLASFKPNDKVKIGYERDGKAQATEATLSEAKDSMHVIKEVEVEVDGEGGENENIWIEEGGKVIELEDGKKMIFIEEGEGKTIKKKKIIKEDGKSKTIEIKIEKKEE